MRRWLPAVAYHRPVSVLMIFIALLVLGVLAYNRIPVQMMPSGFEPRFLWVNVPFPNASPAEADELLVRPIEDQLGTLSGIKKMESNAGTNSAWFSLEFYPSITMDDAYNDVVDRMERAMPDLPDEVGRYGVYKFNPNDSPIIWAGVSLPDEVDDPYHLMNQVVQPRLDRISGVASVEVWGVNDRRILVEYDRDRMLAHGVDIGSVQRSLAGDNFQMSGGRVVDKGQVQHVRSLSRFDSVQDLVTFPIRGDGLVLSDIATVGTVGVGSSDINRINGASAAALGISKESSANTVEVCNAVAAALDELSQDPRAKGAEFFVFFSQGDLIESSNRTLLDAAATGGLFAVFILYAFLREWRMTLLIAASIPFSLLITLTVMYFRGDSLNLIATMGLMLAIGMVVDNAIVVVESIYRQRMDGKANEEAAIEGTAEVNMAILASTATTMVVFLPVILMTEDADASFFMAVMGLPVVFSLAASLVVALVFAPLATRYIGRARIVGDARWLTWMQARYVSILRTVLSRRADTVMWLAAMALLTVTVAVPGVQCTGGEGGNLNNFAIRFSVPRTWSLSERDAYVGRIETVIEDHQDAWGIRVYRARLPGTSNRGSLSIYLDEDGPMTRQDVMDSARELLPDDVAGASATVGWERGAGMGDDNSLTLQVFGEDTAVLTALAEELARRVESVPGIIGAELEQEQDGADEVQLHLDREAAHRYGVSAATVGQTVAFAMRGNRLNPILDGEREVDVETRIELEDRSDLGTLLDFPVWSPAINQTIPVRALTDASFAKGPSSIRRVSRRTSMSVKADFGPDDDASKLLPAIKASLADMVLPRGYTWNTGGVEADQEMEDAAIGFALYMSIAFVYLLMGILFESWVLPLSILSTIPMAIMGAFWGLYASGTDMDTMAGIGLVVLVGVVVNNGIVLVDLVVQLRREHLPREEALLEAGRRRFRPILMTALTTICGLIPMAVGESDFIGIPYAPLGRTVIGGLTAATVLTLIVVPFMYTVLDDVSLWAKRVASEIWSTA